MLEPMHRAVLLFALAQPLACLAQNSANPISIPAAATSSAEIVLSVRAAAAPAEKTDVWTPATWVACGAAFISLLVAALNALQWNATRKDTAKRNRELDQAAQRAKLVEALQWFEGGTQKRTIGLALMEGNWEAYVDLHDTWRLILATQAAYLASKFADNDLSVHEGQNLEQIKRLLLRSYGKAGETGQIPEHVRVALSAAERRKNGL